MQFTGTTTDIPLPTKVSHKTTAVQTVTVLTEEMIFLRFIIIKKTTDKQLPEIPKGK